jgi:hypothetical protein
MGLRSIARPLKPRGVPSQRRKQCPLSGVKRTSGGGWRKARADQGLFNDPTPTTTAGLALSQLVDYPPLALVFDLINTVRVYTELIG